MSELKAYAVWDAGTRWFHWLNVLCVIGLMAVGLVILFGRDLGISGDGKVLLKTVHTLIGYVFALNLIWRFIWGFLGNQHARWQSIKIKRGFIGTVRQYLASIRAGRPEQYLGHNPLGRLSVVLLFALLATQMVTGLVLAALTCFFRPSATGLPSGSPHPVLTQGCWSPMPRKCTIARPTRACVSTAKFLARYMSTAFIP